MTTTAPLPALHPERYAAAPSFTEYLESVDANRDLWHGVYQRARIPETAVDRVREAVPGPRHLLALSEDWCGDAVNTLPVVARLVEQVPGLDFRVLSRDENPDLMDAHLTGTSRSIPVVMVLDEEFNELGWWGPRPGELQAWVLSEGLQMASGERYKVARGWYARDRGLSTIRELCHIMSGEACEDL
jgi:hypothetical protein